MKIFSSQEYIVFSFDCTKIYSCCMNYLTKLWKLVIFLPLGDSPIWKVKNAENFSTKALAINVVLFALWWRALANDRLKLLRFDLLTKYFVLVALFYWHLFTLTEIYWHVLPHTDTLTLTYTNWLILTRPDTYTDTFLHVLPHIDTLTLTYTNWLILMLTDVNWHLLTLADTYWQSLTFTDMY